MPPLAGVWAIPAIFLSAMRNPRLEIFLACACLAGAPAIAQEARPAGAPGSAVQLRLAALALEHGEGIPRDPVKAVEMYCEAARAGDAESQFNLGWMLANGRGITRDDRLAAYFFALAAAQQHVHARNMLRYVGDPQQEVPSCMRDPEPPLPPPAVATTADDGIASLLASVAPAQRPMVDMLLRLAPEYGVNPHLALAVARTESNFNPTAVSPKNAQGLMQLIPETSVRFNVTRPFDPEQNIRGGLSYLRWLLAYFRGQVPLVLAAYNAGEGAVNRFKGIPPYAETRGYVKRIMEAFKKDQHPFDARVAEPSPELPRMRAGKLM